jgi:hypothetical protein
MRMRLTLAIAMLATTLAATAHADPSGASGGSGTDWGRVLLDLDAVARKGADVFDTPRCSAAGCQADTNATAARPEAAQKLNVHNATNSWFNVAPSVSLVARDWSSAYRVAGDRLALVDALRLTTSTRMVLTRFRLSDEARITPFAQVGIGQWRTDPYLLPLTPRYEEVAGQAAGGIEVRLAGSWQLALESTATVLYQDKRDADTPATHIFSSTIATRFEF